MNQKPEEMQSTAFDAIVADGMMRHMNKKATLLFEDRSAYPDGAPLEMRI
ncbi:hypothetical protein LMG22931_01090 [Paraburkholderia nemoris]|nr:hypothetical protein LMG22931_01090 [Paraburkholderia nemoris]